MSYNLNLISTCSYWPLQEVEELSSFTNCWNEASEPRRNTLVWKSLSWRHKWYMILLVTNFVIWRRPCLSVVYAWTYTTELKTVQFIFCLSKLPCLIKFSWFLCLHNSITHGNKKRVSFPLWDIINVPHLNAVNKFYYWPLIMLILRREYFTSFGSQTKSLTLLLGRLKLRTPVLKSMCKVSQQSHKDGFSRWLYLGHTFLKIDFWEDS